MTVGEVVAVSAVVRDKLGSSLDRVLDSLWLVDCQTCNQPLPGRAPSLVIDDLGALTSASLHHHECRPSSWNEASYIRAVANPMLSHRSVCLQMMVPGQDGAEEALKPFVIVNPSMEMVYIERTARRQWNVAMGRSILRAGFTPPPWPPRPIDGAVAELRKNKLIISLIDREAIGSFEMPLDNRGRKLVVDGCGVLVIVTHAVDPHDLSDAGQLEPLFRGDRSVMGYTQLAESSINRRSRWRLRLKRST